jgi:hypothetical protein
LDESVDRGDLPRLFKKAKMRMPHPIVLIELSMRAIPERMRSGMYGFRGRTEMRLTSYALNDEELIALQREMSRDDLSESLQLLNDESALELSAVLSEIETLLEEPEQTEAPPQTEDTNPFSSLFSFREWFSPEPDRLAKDEFVPIAADSDVEAVLRSEAILQARRQCLRLYNNLKHLHHLACFE